MNKTSFAERLNICLDNGGIPPKNRGRIQLLAEMVGLTHRGASKWVNGESVPPLKKFAALAQKFNVNELWLRTGEGEMHDKDFTLPQEEKLLELNVKIYDINHFFEKKILNTMKCTLQHGGDLFGVLLDTEAMSPRFPRGSIIIFDRSDAKDGDFVLVNFNGLPNPIFRQVLIIGGTLYLNAHNPKFDRLILDDKNKIIGRLVQAILSFD